MLALVTHKQFWTKNLISNSITPNSLQILPCLHVVIAVAAAGAERKLQNVAQRRAYLQQDLGKKTKRVKPELDPGKGERMLTIYATTTICYNEQAVEIKLNTGGRQLWKPTGI